jgi:NAD(P)-dependent dehydrogenase (short-subunit alcohol dehydrogenase family)
MARVRGGSIINLSSMQNLIAMPRVFTFSMKTKAVNNLTRNPARERAPDETRRNL